VAAVDEEPTAEDTSQSHNLSGEKSMKRLYLLGVLFALFSTAASAAGNPGRSAMECVTASRDKGDVVFKNNCNYKIFVVWCGEQKYTKKKCGDGPQGNSFYTHSNNIEPGGETWARGIQEYRYAACEGGIGFGKDGIKDAPDGSFQCTAAKSHGDNADADKRANAAAPTGTSQQKPASQGSPVGSWQIVTDTGEKLTLSLSANGSSLYAGEYPGRWSRQGNRVTVQSFADNDFMRRNENPSIMELEFAGNGMTGTQLAQRVGNKTYRAQGMTLTRAN
jgi:hypothetical protein